MNISDEMNHSGSADFRHTVDIIISLRYRNQECEGKLGQNGTCVTQADCDAKQGTDVGSCAEGYGVCCRGKRYFGGSL